MSYDDYGDYNGYAPAAAEHYVRTICVQIYFRTLYADFDYVACQYLNRINSQFQLIFNVTFKIVNSKLKSKYP